jgi:hypothetical protein
MFLLVLLSALGIGGVSWYLAHQENAPGVSPTKLLTVHWYRVLWNVSGPVAAGGAVAAKAAVEAAMRAQGFTGELAVLEPVKRPDGSFNVQATGPYVLGPGSLTGVPGSLITLRIDDVEPTRLANQKLALANAASAAKKA